MPPWFTAENFVRGYLILFAADIITGVLLAIKLRNIDSTVAREGLTKKVGMLLLLITLKALERYAFPELPIAGTVAPFYCWYEGSSLIENLGRLNVPIPVAIKQFFAKLNPEDQDAA